MIASTALLCLSLNIFHESRGELIPGQYAVALVTMNRAGGREERVCHEVFKPKQFSWANGKAKKTSEGWKVSAGLRPRDSEAWERALHIASWTLAGRMPDLTHGSTHYHTHAVRPVWRHALQPTKTLGNHRFYRSIQ